MKIKLVDSFSVFWLIFLNNNFNNNGNNEVFLNYKINLFFYKLNWIRNSWIKLGMRSFLIDRVMVSIEKSFN